MPTPGPQNGRWASEPITGLTSLEGERLHGANTSITLATDKGDTVGRVLGEPLTGRRTPPPVAFEAPPVPAPAPEPEEAVPAKVEPVPVVELPADALVEATEPPMLREARGGKPDDLKKIKGVGPKLEGVLNGLGVYHFDQIAAWTPAEVAWVDQRLKFKGRIERDDWIGQAKTMAGLAEEDS